MNDAYIGMLELAGEADAIAAGICPQCDDSTLKVDDEAPTCRACGWPGAPW